MAIWRSEIGPDAAPVQSVDGKTGAVDLSADYQAKAKRTIAAAAPTVNDDETQGYSVWSR